MEAVTATAPRPGTGTPVSGFAAHMARIPPEHRAAATDLALAAVGWGRELGYRDGQADAAVALAGIEDHREAAGRWRRFAATVRRIIESEQDPAGRMRRVMREIADDQRFIREARARQATRPWALSPLEACVLRRARFADPGDDA